MVSSPEVLLPRRETQLILCRVGFAISYLVIGANLSNTLIMHTVDTNKWVANVVLDILLLIVFLVYCYHIDCKSVSTHLFLYICFSNTCCETIYLFYFNFNFCLFFKYYCLFIFNFHVGCTCSTLDLGTTKGIFRLSG